MMVCDRAQRQHLLCLDRYISYVSIFLKLLLTSGSFHCVLSGRIVFAQKGGLEIKAHTCEYLYLNVKQKSNQSSLVLKSL